MQASAQARGSRNGRARDEHPGEPPEPDGRGPGAPALRAGGYVRVSQERNLVGRYGMDAQLAEVERYVRYRGWSLSEVYRENGVSGYVRERPALDRLLADAKVGKLDVAIFPSIDRAARSVRDMIEIDDALREVGVTVVFVREGVDTSSHMGQFFRNICASIAQFEGKLIYERMSKGKRRKAAQGGYTGGWLPYGYRRGKRRAVVVEEEAAVVRKIFEWRFGGRSFGQIVRMLKRRRVKTKRGGRWSMSTVRNICGRAFYAGWKRYGDGYVRGKQEAIISVETFNKAQTVFYDNVGEGHPYGYRRAKRRAVVVEEEAAVVRQMFAWRLEGRSYGQIVRELERRNVRTKRGGRWTGSTVRDICRRAYYAGWKRCGDGHVRGQQEAIISVETFNKAQMVFYDDDDRRHNESKRLQLPEGK